MKKTVLVLMGFLFRLGKMYATNDEENIIFHCLQTRL